AHSSDDELPDPRVQTSSAKAPLKSNWALSRLTREFSHRSTTAIRSPSEAVSTCCRCSDLITAPPAPAGRRQATKIMGLFTHTVHFEGNPAQREIFRPRSLPLGRRSLPYGRDDGGCMLDDWCLWQNPF